MAPMVHNNFCEGRRCRPDLIFAARENDLDGVKKALTEPDVDINVTDSTQSTALVYAVENNNFEMVKCLLDHNADVNKRFPLYMARTAEIARLLIAHGANVNVKNEGFLCGADLRFVIMAEHYDVAKLLIESGADINIKMGFPHVTPLHCAVIQPNPDMIKFLLKHKADASITDKDPSVKQDDSSEPSCCCVRNLDPDEEQEPNTPKTAFQYAMSAKDKTGKILRLFEKYDIQKRMLEPTKRIPTIPTPEQQKSDENTSSSTYLLFEAVSNGNLTAVENALKMQDVDINCSCYYGTPILCQAVERGNRAIIACLLEHGADPNLTDPSLYHVYDPEIAQLLVDYGAHVNQEIYHDGMTILGWIIEQRRYGVAKVLVRNGADVNINVRNYLTPLHLAIKKKRIGLVEILLKYGADGKTLPQDDGKNNCSINNNNCSIFSDEFRCKQEHKTAAKTPLELIKEEDEKLAQIIKIFNDHGIYE